MKESKENMRKKTSRVTVRVPEELLEKFKQKALLQQEDPQVLLKTWISWYVNSSHLSTIPNVLEVLLEELLKVNEKLDKLEELKTALILAQIPSDYFKK